MLMRIQFLKAMKHHVAPWAKGEDMSRSTWTADDVERLRKLAQASLSLTERAREMGRSLSNIRTRALS